MVDTFEVLLDILVSLIKSGLVYGSLKSIGKLVQSQDWLDDALLWRNYECSRELGSLLTLGWCTFIVTVIITIFLESYNRFVAGIEYIPTLLCSVHEKVSHSRTPGTHECI